jgi:hypothetical protein
MYYVYYVMYVLFSVIVFMCDLTDGEWLLKVTGLIELSSF